MANEITVVSKLTVRTGNLRYSSPGANFQANMTGAKGPSPGAITASVSGTDIDLSQLTRAGVCEFVNLDETNFVTLGIYEPATGVFYPFVELLPGENYVVRLSRSVQEQRSGTVTGTGTDAVNNTVRAIADTASVNLFVGAFEA